MNFKLLFVFLLITSFILSATLTFADEEGEVEVTASVPPDISDYSISIDKVTSGTTFSENQEIQFKITYSSTTGTPFPATIVANWTLGTPDGSGSATVDIADYVVGSATNSDDGTTPTINTTNRTITWAINALPANASNKTVFFKLKTTSNYTSSSAVTFDVIANLTSYSETTPDDSVTVTYQYSGASTTTTTTSSSSSPQATPTPTPTSTNQTNVTTVNVAAISATQAIIEVNLNNPQTTTIRYGINPRNLNNTLTSPTQQLAHTFTLLELSPETTYYFKITSENKTTTETFTFTTAKVSPPPQIKQGSLIISQDNNIVGFINPDSQFPTIVLPVGTTYNIRLNLENPNEIKDARIHTTNRNVLGINNYSNFKPDTQTATLSQIQPGIYTGNLITPKNPSKWEIFATISDYNGNFVKTKIADLNVSPRLKITSGGNPIEDARVEIFFLNNQTKLFEKLSPHNINIKNPIHSEPNGEIFIVLPQGKYKAVVEAIGFEKKEQEFEIGPGDNQLYPEIALVKSPFNIANIISYYTKVMTDVLHESKVYIQRLATSTRFFDLITVSAVLFLTFTTFLTFMAKTHSRLLSFPKYFGHLIKHTLGKSQLNQKITGRILDHNGNYHSQALVLLQSNSELIESYTTNKTGEFIFKKPESVSNLSLITTKKGYLTKLTDLNKDNLQNINIEIEKDEKFSEKLLHKSVSFITKIFGIYFESFLLLSLIAELAILYYLGWQKALPPLVVTIFNLLIYILYIRRLNNSNLRPV